MERTNLDEEGIFVGIFPSAPRSSRSDSSTRRTVRYKNDPLDKIGFFRQALRVSSAPTPVRRFLWWSTLNVSGVKRAKRFGTYGLSSYGSLGAESLHPISPLTTTMTYGPIDRTGKVTVKLIYDHRVLDGAYIARRLQDIEATLHGAILEELRRDSAATKTRSSRHDGDDLTPCPPPPLAAAPHVESRSPGPRGPLPRLE